MPFLQHLRPDARSASRRPAYDTTTYFDVAPAPDSRDPSVVAKGIDRQVTGTRASRIIADDVETEVNARTLDSCRELAKKVDEFTAI